MTDENGAAFLSGFIFACFEVADAQGQPDIAANMLNSAAITEAQIRRADLGDGYENTLREIKECGYPPTPDADLPTAEGVRGLFNDDWEDRRGLSELAKREAG